MNKQIKILILSRKYPPSIGGMQTYAKNFIQRMENIYKVDKIVLGKTQAHLVWFLPYLFLKSLFLLAFRKYDLVYLCDGLLAPFGLFFKRIFGVRVMATVHGLDVTYQNPLYQFVVPRSMAALDRVVCVSGSTRRECIKRGIPKDVCAVIPNGMNPDEYSIKSLTERWDEKLFGLVGDFVMGKKILVTVGRLVKRKGVDWFVVNVLPKLDDDYVYIVSGEGPEKGAIAEKIRRYDMRGRVKLLGKLSHDDLRVLYRSARAMVIPNRKIQNDIEGFGIVAIEAASAGLPVVASAVDGVTEAVIEGETGWLVNEGDPAAFAEKIKNLNLDRAVVQKKSEQFSWRNVIEKYREEIERVVR